MEEQNGETYLKDMMTWTNETIDDESLMEQSEIIKFYDNCNVLITGGSGFMGTLLVEKLLRYVFASIAIKNDIFFFYFFFFLTKIISIGISLITSIMFKTFKFPGVFAP